MNGFRRSRRAWAVLLGSFGMLMSATSAHAEPFSSLYLGFSLTSDSTYTINGVAAPASLTCFSACSSTMAPSGGIRVGYWFERLPWLGVAGDVSAFVASWGIQSPVEVVAYPITPLVAVRGRLIQQEGYPHGRVQPYLAIGPSLYVSTATVGSGWAALGTSSQASSTTADIGLDFRAGVEILTTTWFGMLLEYRYTYAKPTWEIEGANYETALSNNQFILGIVAHY